MASDYLLEIDGIKGESNDSKHAGTIEISSFSWGASNSGSFAHGSGGGAGKVAFQDIHFTTSVNKSSPLLALHCANGAHIKKAVLFVRKAGKEQQDYYTITLTDLLVSSYQAGGSEGAGSLPTDQFSLNFTTIKFEYKIQDEKGALKPGAEYGWNLKENKAL
jgi:type VI secretion system secreted protein Hcp